MSDSGCGVIYLTWVPPEEPEPVYRARIGYICDILSSRSDPEFDAPNKLRFARFWRKRMPLVRKLLGMKWSQYVLGALYQLNYFPQELIMDSILHMNNFMYRHSINDKGGMFDIDKGEALVKATKNKYVDWNFARHLPKNVCSDDIAMRRLFSISLSVHSLAHLIKQNMLTAVSIAQGKPVRFKTISSAREGVEKAVRTSLRDPTAYNEGTIIELLRLVSLNFKKNSGAKSKHHPYHFHTNKLEQIRLRLMRVLSKILEVCSANLREEYLNNHCQIIVEGGEYCLQTLIPMIAIEYRKIQDLIVVVEKNGFYSRSVATSIVQSFPKGSSERTSVAKKLRQEGRIPSEKTLRTQLLWCETRPIIDQRWRVKSGPRKIKPISGQWWGSVVMDLYPVEMRLTDWDNQFITDEMMTSIITMDLYSIARRVEVSDYLWSNKQYRLYFCPKQFCIPFDIEEAWNVDAFLRLRWYVEYSSMQGDSPVKYNGKEDRMHARFRCTQCNKEGKRCPFSFTVKADQF